MFHNTQQLKGKVKGHDGYTPLSTTHRDGCAHANAENVGLGGILETFGGALILIGLFTRPVAFILSGMMAVAYWQFHAPQNYIWPIINQGVPAALFCFVWLYFSAAGAGPISVDALRSKEST